MAHVNRINGGIIQEIYFFIIFINLKIFQIVQLVACVLADKLAVFFKDDQSFIQGLKNVNIVFFYIISTIIGVFISEKEFKKRLNEIIDEEEKEKGVVYTKEEREQKVKLFYKAQKIIEEQRKIKNSGFPLSRE